MRIEYELAAEDWADFGEYCARTSRDFRHHARAGVLGGLFLILGGCVLFWVKSGSMWWMAVGLGAAFAWSWFWPRRLVSHVRAHMSQRQLPCLTGRHVLEATPEGLLAKCDITESTTRWTGVSSVVNAARHVFVMLNEVQGYVIPKGRISVGDIDQFVRQAQAYSSLSGPQGGEITTPPKV